MIALNSVTKRFQLRNAPELTAIDDVSTQIHDGSTTALIGPSGCGKSTLLRLINGLIIPDSGTITVLGTTLSPGTPLRELRLRIGYVIQSAGLFPHMTARRNATLVASRLGWKQQRINDRLDQLAALTHFPTQALDRYPSQLSGGQRQRVGLMRALMLDPEVLLLDEPMGALDPMIRAELQQDLRDIFQQLAKTVVLVTHDLAEAVYLAHRIVLLRKGQIVQEGPPGDLFERPASDFVTRFVGAQRATHRIAADNGNNGA